MQTALLILPNFVLILVGLALARGFDYGRGFWEGLEKLVYFVLFPALLLRSLAVSTLDLASVGKVVACGVGDHAARHGARLARAAALPRGADAWPPRASSAPSASTPTSASRWPGASSARRASRWPPSSSAPLIPLANLGAVGDAGRAVAHEPLARARAQPARRVHARRASPGTSRALGMPGFLDQTLNLLGQSALPAGLLAVGAALRIERGRASVARARLVARREARGAAARGVGLRDGCSGSPASRPACWCCGRRCPPPPAPTSSPCAWAATARRWPRRSRSGTLISMATIPLWIAAVAVRRATMAFDPGRRSPR